MKPTLFFYGNPIDDSIREWRAITSDSPAGTRKMVEVSRALRAANVRVVLVSMGRGRSNNSGRFDGVRLRRIGGGPVIYGPMLHLRGLSEALSLLWLAWTAFKLARRDPEARHLFYNQFTAYLPALFILRMMGRATFCDIEDGPVGAGERLNWGTRGNASPKLFARFISHGALLACTALAAKTAIRPVMPCYGAVDLTAPLTRQGGDKLVIIMSGMFDDATGVDLMEQAFARIASEQRNFAGLRFEFAGFGPRLASLEHSARQWGVDAVFHGRLGSSAYAELLGRGSIGLSLKAMSGPYAQTTFPSKVVEYAQHGLCVITTNISDVRQVLGEAALYLESDDPEQLLMHLRHASRVPHDIAALGRRARERVEDTLSYVRVGHRLREFLYNGANR